MSDALWIAVFVPVFLGWLYICLRFMAWLFTPPPTKAQREAEDKLNRDVAQDRKDLDAAYQNLMDYRSKRQ